MAGGYDIGGSVAPSTGTGVTASSPVSVLGGGVTNTVLGVLSRGGSGAIGESPLNTKTLLIIAGTAFGLLITAALLFRR